MEQNKKVKVYLSNRILAGTKDGEKITANAILFDSFITLVWFDINYFL